MLVDDSRTAGLIDALERLRELLHELELSRELSAGWHEQVREARLRTDRETEVLRPQ
jgi:hypothetical protein